MQTSMIKYAVVAYSCSNTSDKYNINEEYIYNIEVDDVEGMKTTHNM